MAIGHTVQGNIKEVIVNLEKTSETLLAWFRSNNIKANPNKYHLLVNNKDETYPINVVKKTITDSKCERLLGTQIDQIDHIQLLCKKTSQKINALPRVAYELQSKVINHECV